MISKIKSAWARLRAHYWLSLSFDAMLILAVFFAIHAWQTRELPIDEAAPETILQLLDGSGPLQAVQPGQAGIVYFFAPWCFYCRHSIDNLDGLLEQGKVDWAVAVALDYMDSEEVAVFVEETGISLPVLMGDAQTAADWSIRAFPTYYVIDPDGRIASRSVGYSTRLGMRARAWMAK